MPKDALYEKYVRFQATSPSTASVVAQSGYGTVGISIVDGEIIITSSGEFVNIINLDDTQNSSAAWIDASTIKFKPIASWGTLEGEIVSK